MTITETPTSGPKTGALPLQWDVVTFPDADPSAERWELIRRGGRSVRREHGDGI